MPKGVPGSGKAALRNKPAEGGAVGGGTEARTQIVDMLAPGSEDDFRKSLTDPPENAAPKKTRRTKAEMEAASAPVDPNMADPIYKKSIERLQGFGVPKIANFACTAAGKAMDTEETEDVKAITYVIAKKGNIDVGKSWIFLVLSAVGITVQLFVARTDVGKQIKLFFESLKKKPETAKPEEKAA